MCIAKEIVNNLIQLLDQVETEYKNLTEQHSKCDKIEQDILHKVENSNFNACEGFYLAKNLQEVRRYRRLVKNEIPTMDALKSYINIKQLKSQFENTLKNINTAEEKLGKKYHPKILKGENKNGVNLVKLRAVNQVPNLKFKPNKKQERIEELFKQISQAN